MKVTINLTKQEAIESLLQFYKHTGASEIIISDEINKMLKPEPKPKQGEWISNIGNDTRTHPDSISSDALIEVRYRDGSTYTGRVCDWSARWRETDGHPSDVVAYRVLKD